MVGALREDFRTAPISEQDKVMLEYVVKLTRDATQCRPEDPNQLRRAGFDDRGILQITLIAAWFNYINRVADALGVGRDWSAEDLIRQRAAKAAGTTLFVAGPNWLWREKFIHETRLEEPEI